jgi:serine/threonine-protein kinase
MPDFDPKLAQFKPEADLSGQRLGDYHLIRRLGRGGMAEVYLAEQGSLRRQVAFKVLREALAKEDSYVRRFHNEAQAAAALVDANIVQIYEVGCLEGVHFIAQEYVAGKNLMQLLVRKGPLDIKLAVNILRQVAAALHRAGQRGVTHRDIKPENILLTSGGEVKVADFGLARVTSREGKVDLTQVGVTMGTPLFMSPEQIEGSSVDPRSDLYSLGVTAYQMLAGRPPFEGETPLSVAIQHLNNEPKPLNEWRPDLDSDLARIVHRLLAKKPEARYQTAADVLRDLRGLQIEGLEEGWPSDIEQWAGSDLRTTLDHRFAATQQLQSVMVAETQRQRTRRPWWFVVAVPATFVAGTVLAWLSRPDSLLDIASNQEVNIQQKASAEKQFGFAKELWTVRAFNSVSEHFPPEDSLENELYGYRAKLQLAYLLEPDQPDVAMEHYEALANQDLDSVLKAFGLIGQANIHVRQGRRSKAAQCVDTVADVLAMQEHIRSGNRLGWLEQWTQRLDPALREDLTSALRTQLRSLTPRGGRGTGS